MANNFHDINGLLLVGIEGHSGFHIFPPMPMWFWKLTFVHPFVLGDKAKPTVMMNGVPSVTHGHEPTYLWPHLGIIPDPLDLMTPLQILMGSQKCWLPRGQVIICGEPSTCCVIGGPISINADCWEVGSWPTSLVLQPGTVQTTPTFADYLAGVVELAVMALVDWLFGKIMDLGMELIGRGLKRIVSAVAERFPGLASRFSKMTQSLRCLFVGDPIDPVTCAVVDREVDLHMPGLIAIDLTRTMFSLRGGERGPLGFGGWRLSIDLWVRVEEDGIFFHDAEGRLVKFPVVPVGSVAVLRGERLRLRRVAEDEVHIEHLRTGLRSIYRPIEGAEGLLVTRITDDRGAEITMHHEEGRLAIVRSEGDRKLVLDWTHGGRLHRAELHAGGALVDFAAYRYDARGNLASVETTIARDGYRYDDDHRIVEKTLRNGTRVFYRYDDETGLCAESWADGDLHHVRLRRDIERTLTVIDGVRPRVIHWNADGLVVREETPDGLIVAAFDHDQDGLVVRETRPGPTVTEHVYDALGNRVSQRGPGRCAVGWTWDDVTLVAERDLETGVAVRFEHEGGLLRKVAAPGGETTFAYDAEGRVREVKDTRGLHFEQSFPGERTIEQTLGGVKRVLYLDALGRTVRVVDGDGGAQEIDYDARGREVARRSNRVGSAVSAWDAFDNRTMVRSPNGREIHYRHAGTGQLAGFEEIGVGRWEVIRDGVERVTGLVNPNGDRMEISLDALDRPTVEKTFDGRTFRYEYRGASALAAVEQPGGNVVRIRFEDGGRTTIVEDEERCRTVSLAPNGDLVGARLDEPNRVTEVKLERHLSGSGEARRVVQVVDGEPMTWWLDDADRPVAVRVADGPRVPAGGGFRLAREGSAVRATSPEGAEVTWHMNEVIGRPAGVTVTARGRRVLDRAFRYDAHGSWIATIEDGVEVMRSARDAGGRLRMHTTAGVASEMDHDGAGNIIERRVDGRPVEREIAAGGRLVRSGDRSFEYDACGRRTRVREPSGETVLVWDSFDRLREVSATSGSTVRYSYDAFGRLSRREVSRRDGSTEVERLRWDGTRLAASNRGREWVHWLYEPSLGRQPFTPHVRVEGGRACLCVTDPAGRITELVDGSGEIVARRKLGAFGDEVEHRGSEGVFGFGLAGQYRDVDTGFMVTPARWFDPAEGVWLSPDPIGITGGPGAYDFNASPLDAIDPLGLACMDLTKQMTPDELAKFERGFLPDSLANTRMTANYQNMVNEMAEEMGIPPPRVILADQNFFGHRMRTGYDMDVILIKPNAGTAALQHEMIHGRQWMDALTGNAPNVLYNLQHYYMPSLGDYLVTGAIGTGVGVGAFWALNQIAPGGNWLPVAAALGMGTGVWPSLRYMFQGVEAEAFLKMWF